MPSPASSAPSARPRASDPPAASPRPPPPPYPLARAPPIRRPHPLTRLLRPIRSPARLRSGAPIPSPASFPGDFSKRAPPNSWVGEDGSVWHSHDGLAPHSREPIYSPGDFSKRAPPLDSHRFADRAFTVGIGGPVGTGMTALMLALCRFLRHKYSLAADRAAYMFLLFPSTLLLLRWWIWDGCLPALAVQVYQAWLLFLYTSFALRENVLIVNGSDIRPWWIYHHYLAMLMALVSLTWEIKGQADCSSKQRGVQLFLRWAIMQGIAMHLQNRYQRQRLHTRIALGKAKRMDVVADFL